MGLFNAAKAEEDQDRDRGYLRLLGGGPKHFGDAVDDDSNLQDLTTAPLFSGQVRHALRHGGLRGQGIFPQYGLLGARLATCSSQHGPISQPLQTEENFVFANMNAPWSTFICGSQGAGKSHSLSCLLENSLLATSSAGVNPKPLAGLVFHYDSFTGYETAQLCEAAYLCSAGVPVRVLVSRSNFAAMHKLYNNLPGLPANGPKPEVIPLYFSEKQLNISRMLTLMAVRGNGQLPLYIEVLNKILRDMAMERRDTVGIDYLEFKARLKAQAFNNTQLSPLRLRLQLLESFLAHRVQSEQGAAQLDGLFKSAQGTLTIIDLSCPFIDANDACVLFSICMSSFLENRSDCGRIIALDEAHKVTFLSFSAL
jgi:hypothetical protein